MENSVIGSLFDRAERAGAALVVCNDEDQIIRVNDKHAKIYDLIDFARKPTFNDTLWRFIESGRAADPVIYQNPQAWVEAASGYRRNCDLTQFMTRHANGRVLLVCYEKLRGASTWWYQVRIDITEEVKARFSQDDGLLGPSCWNGHFSPLARNASFSVNNILEVMPTAAGLIMARGKLLDVNRGLAALLNCGDGLLQVGDRVAARDPSEQAEFQRRLARFFKPGGQRASVAMRISREDRDEPYLISVSSLLNQGRQAWDSGHIGVLTVANLAATPTVDPRLVGEFFGITRAEAEVAVALGAGHTTAAIAAQRGVQSNTIYAQIKKIIEKTGYKGQADIARRVTDIARIFGNQQCRGERR